MKKYLVLMILSILTALIIIPLYSIAPEFILFEGEILEVINSSEIYNLTYETLLIGDGYILVEINGKTYYVKE